LTCCLKIKTVGKCGYNKRSPFLAIFSIGTSKQLSNTCGKFFERPVENCGTQPETKKQASDESKTLSRQTENIPLSVNNIHWQMKVELFQFFVLVVVNGTKHVAWNAIGRELIVISEDKGHLPSSTVAGYHLGTDNNKPLVRYYLIVCIKR